MTQDDSDLSPAGEAFVEFLERKAAGEDLEFDSFCEDRPQLEAELRILHRNWRAFEKSYELASRPPTSGSFLRGALDEDQDPQVTLSGDSRVLGEISQMQERETRYHEGEEVARGGMGAILKVWDRDLRRTLAMKVLLHGKGGSAAQADARSLARFLEEAQITGQLEYPGIVPVHELGVDASGRVYFTMPLIRGRTLGEVFELSRRQDESEWTTIRALGAVLRATEAVVYAHSKGVIHRDLKPSNIMVGAFGETYVMDWGLAKVLGREEKQYATDETVRTTRSEDAESGSESELLTRDGTVMGTPAYLPPEQAQARLEEVGPRSDVYAIGAILYELLAGDAPYLAGEESRGPHEILAAISSGPPRSVASLASDVPAELTAVCEKAMAYAPEDRYDDMKALADDLRAYLEGRVVRAFETGAVAELKKWVSRNRPLAAAIMAAALFAFAGLGAVAWLESTRRDEAEALNESLRLAKNDASDQAELAQERAQDVLRLSDLKLVEQQERLATRLWPAYPDNIEAYETWLATTRTLRERLESFHRSKLAQLADAAESEGNAPSRDAGLSVTEFSIFRRNAFEETLAEWRELLEELEAEDDDDEELRDQMEYMERALEAMGGPVQALPSEFEESERQWEYEAIAELVRRLEKLTDEEQGTAREMLDRLDLARRIERDTLKSDAAVEAWNGAIASIADEAECPVYRGRKIVPQIGLMPIGRDTQSGLWEFCHIQSGSIPERNEEGKLNPTEDTGIVLVLLPGGNIRVGSQSADKDASNYDPRARRTDGPVRSVRIDPFFISKYEMTQGQWLRFAGRNPAGHTPEKRGERAAGVTLDHPVESVSWFESYACLMKQGLVLPTEAQWEFATRANDVDPNWMYDENGTVEGIANLSDETLRKYSATMPPGYVYEPWDDGYSWHAPVGTYRANPYGLHDVFGNVVEWCFDEYCPQLILAFRPGDGLHLYLDEDERRSARGGSFFDYWILSGPGRRDHNFADFSSDSYGVRPARELDR